MVALLRHPADILGQLSVRYAGEGMSGMRPLYGHCWHRRIFLKAAIVQIYARTSTRQQRYKKVHLLWPCRRRAIWHLLVYFKHPVGMGKACSSLPRGILRSEIHVVTAGNQNPPQGPQRNSTDANSEHEATL